MCRQYAKPESTNAIKTTGDFNIYHTEIGDLNSQQKGLLAGL
jgi:hypothetical protein